MRLKKERWELLELAWLASIALAQSRLRLGHTRLRWHERLLGAAASAEQQHEGRRGQAQESEREWVLGQELGQSWACLRVTRSSEHEYGEFR